MTHEVLVPCFIGILVESGFEGKTLFVLSSSLRVTQVNNLLPSNLMLGAINRALEWYPIQGWWRGGFLTSSNTNTHIRLVFKKPRRERLWVYGLLGRTQNAPHYKGFERLDIYLSTINVIDD